MQATLYTLAALVPTAALGGLAGAYCALVADAYVAALLAGGEPDASCLRKALGQAFQRIPEQAALLAGQAPKENPCSAGVPPDKLPGGKPPVASRGIVSACMALMAICFSILGQVHGLTLSSLVLAVACATLLVLALIDAHTRLLPDALTLPVMWAGLALAWGGWGIALRDAVLGAMAGYGFLWSLFWIFKCLSGREGMGYGDFKLLAALGAWTGWRVLAMVLLASCVAAVLFAMLRQRTLTPDGAYPFGPFLAASGTAGLLFGSYLTGFDLTRLI